MTPDEQHQKLNDEGYFEQKERIHQMSEETKRRFDVIDREIEKLELRLNKEIGDVRAEMRSGLGDIATTMVNINNGINDIRILVANKVDKGLMEEELEKRRKERKKDVWSTIVVLITVSLALMGFFWQRTEKLEIKIEQGFDKFSDKVEKIETRQDDTIEKQYEIGVEVSAIKAIIDNATIE